MFRKSGAAIFLLVTFLGCRGTGNENHSNSPVTPQQTAAVKGFIGGGDIFANGVFLSPNGDNLSISSQGFFVNGTAKRNYYFVSTPDGFFDSGFYNFGYIDAIGRAVITGFDHIDTTARALDLQPIAGLAMEITDVGYAYLVAEDNLIREESGSNGMLDIDGTGRVEIGLNDGEIRINGQLTGAKLTGTSQLRGDMTGSVYGYVGRSVDDDHAYAIGQFIGSSDHGDAYIGNFAR